jgi:putative oxidoreductase
MSLIRTLSDSSAFVARVTLGGVMLPHGLQKVLGWFGGEGFRGTIDAMGQLGIPASVAILVMATELLGSLALLAGLLGRLAAAGVACVMVAAVVLVHSSYGFFMNWTGTKPGEGFEYHLLALGLAIVVMIRGSGAWSLDGGLAPAPDTLQVSMSTREWYPEQVLRESSTAPPAKA